MDRVMIEARTGAAARPQAHPRTARRCLLSPTRTCPNALQPRQRGGRPCVRAAAATDAEEDLWQYKDREQWYLPKWAAMDQPDWNAATFVSSSQLAPGVKEVVLEVEISRERVPIRNAYKHVGQAARVRVNGGVEVSVPPSSPPFNLDLNRDALLRVRGDMTAGEIKTAVDEGSVKAELTLVVRESAAQELYRAGEGDAFEMGPFEGTGLDLRGPIAGIFQFPTLVVFCEGDGIAAARALVHASPAVGGLSCKMRQDVRMYYRAPNTQSLCYAAELEQWQELGVQVVTSTRGTFSDMFDDDETLVYDPLTTAALVLTGMEEDEAEAAALEACKEAEIAVVVRQTQGQAPTVYLTSGKGGE